MRAYHLLSAEYGLSDLSLRRIKISRYGDLNDPFELFAADVSDDRERRALRNMKNHFDKTQGILCFSKSWNNPVLWSHYGAKHRGMCLGFDLDDAFVQEIDYSGKRLPLQFEDSSRTTVKRDYISKLVLTKFEHWQYENEVRMIVQLDEGTVENGSYFFSFSESLALREVILGPLCELPVEAIRSLVESMHSGVVVRKARLAFKSFEVVPDQRYETTKV